MMSTTMADGTLLVVRADLTPAVRQRLSFDPTVVVFSVSESAHALAMVVQRGLPVIALDRQFATSPRGAEFMGELRSARPDSEIRILSDQGSDIPLLLRRPVLGSGRATIAAGSQVLAGAIRRAPRYPVQSGCAALVNGEPSSLVNVSVTGAQVLSQNVLKPFQQVRIALADEVDAIKVKAAVAWSSFERSRKTGEICYRAGVEFADAEPRLLAAYCNKYGVQI